MDTETSDRNEEEAQEEKPFLKVIIHSFFIIPFLIAVFCVLLFASIHLLTSEKRSVYDYLEDVKTGGLNKRWQGAFELSKILGNPEHLPKEERFANELISAFEHAKHDDNRVRQYLALAMGRTEDRRYVQPLVSSLEAEREENLSALIYALGMLKDKESALALHPFVNHADPKIRSIAVVSLGNIANPRSLNVIKKGLADVEENVQWGAAISLAQMGDASGKRIIADMLNRSYFAQFPEVDKYEKTQLILTAIQAAGIINDPDLNNKIEQLAQSDQNMKVRSAAMKVLEN